MKTINVRRLREELFGEDRIPTVPFSAWPHSVVLKDYHGEPICETQITILDQHPRETRKRRNRILCNCPQCGKLVPVGRLRQHYKIHETV